MSAAGKTASARIIKVLLDRYGQTYSEELGIDLKSPSPSALFRWLCATMLFSARINTRQAIRAAKALRQRGWTTPRKMTATTWEDRTRTLNRAGYARYDESTSTKLAAASALLLEKYKGDLRNLREAAGHNPARERELIEEFKGIGEVGADIFCREMQVAWNELAPFADRKALSVAEHLGLGKDAKTLAKQVPPDELPRLMAALVRCGLAKAEEEILEAAKHNTAGTI